MKKMIVAALSLALLISALALCACGKTPVEAGREKLISAANKIANNPNVPKRDAGTYEEKLGKYSERLKPQIMNELKNARIKWKHAVLIVRLTNGSILRNDVNETSPEWAEVHRKTR